MKRIVFFSGALRNQLIVTDHTEKRSLDLEAANRFEAAPLLNIQHRHHAAPAASEGVFPSLGRTRQEKVRQESSTGSVSNSYRPPSPFGIEPISAFYIFLIANIVAALFAPIQDCDETFNYWEPTHYLSHGYGLQTWEYSPEYSIRSWLYIALHAIPANLRRLLPRSDKVRPGANGLFWLTG